jgi:hypothetical protein
MAIRRASFMIYPPLDQVPPPSGGHGGLSGVTHEGDNPEYWSTSFGVLRT